MRKSAGAIAVIGLGFAALSSSSPGQQSVTDQTQLMMAARSVCVGVIARFANTPDPDSQISYDQGRFRVIRSKNSVTVLEDNVKIAELPKFDYSNYVTCLEKMTRQSQ